MGMNKPYHDVSELPDTIPVFPLTGALLLPRGQMPLNIFEPRYLAMTDHAIGSDRLIGMIQPADSSAPLQGNPRLRDIGCAGRLTQFAETGDGRYVMTLTGVCRFRLVTEVVSGAAFRQFKVDFAAFQDDLLPREQQPGIDRTELVQTLITFSDAANMRIDRDELDKADNEMLVNAISMSGPFGPEEKQALLEAKDLTTRCQALVAIMEIELAQHLAGSSKLQ